MTSPSLEPGVHGADSYWLKTDKVELYISRVGGHMAPVRFKLKHRWVAPYSLAPWKPEEVPGALPPVLRHLRGDFFCLPFGDSPGIPYTHGDTANLGWELVSHGVRGVVLEMDLQHLEGRVRKSVSALPGQRALYLEHEVAGLRGHFNYGHHAVLQFPADGGDYRVNVSPFVFGQVKPEPFNDPAAGEYGALRPGATFRSLSRVGLATGGTADLSRYPARAGFEDLVMVSARPGPLAWTAATLDGYVWFCLKDPRVLPSTLFWISNGGRHGEPWRGRHRNRLGLEEVNSYFCDGLKNSRKGLLAGKGIATTGHFSRSEPTRVRVIQAVHPVAADFGMVTRIRPEKGGRSVVVKGASGATVAVPLDWAFLQG